MKNNNTKILNKIKTFAKNESNVVGVGVPDDPKTRQKYINKPMSNVLTSNTAITLIALIITIIVLLILAGVTLNMVMGDSGIFSKANNAKNKTEVAQYEEELRMCILELQTDTATNGTTFNMETIKNKLVEKVKELENTEEIEITSPEGNATIEGTYKGYEYKIDEKYVVHIGNKATGIILTTSLEPKGWTNQNVTATITIKSNNGINKVEPDEGSKNGNEYIITKENIAENTSFKYTVTDGQGNTKEKTAIINTIDKDPPADFTITAENTENGLQITGTTTDSESGIDKYEYYAKKTTDADYTKYESNPITGLSNGTYDIKVIAYDKAGNTKESVLNSFKVEKAIKRTDISAADIKSNPEGYYGQTVDYTSENGQNDWKIFHSDGTNIYLITGDLVKVTDESGNIDTSKINANTKMQKADTTSDYCVNWNETNLPSFQTLSSDIISKFKIDTSVFDINGRKGNPNVQCVSTLLNSDNWTSYIDSRMGENQYAIGGPTIELWTDSWNSIKDKKLYCNNSNANGYYIGTTVFSKTESVELKSNINNTEKIYFVNSEKGIYWMASPSAHYQNNLMRVKSSGEIDYYRFSVEECAIRPVVCLTSNISLK